MTFLYILLAMLAAVCFYVATSHARIVALTPRHRTIVRGCGVVLSAIAIAVAMQPLGFWAGFYAVLTAFMLGCVALPYVDAWLSKMTNAMRSKSHVG